MSDKGLILVVDDTEATRYLVARILRGDGYQVLEAGTGGEALELARGRQPDLLVLDVVLPDILGFEVAEILKGDPATRSIAIVQLSASFTQADAQVEGLRRGADAYLTHPVDPQVLCATVHALLRLRRAEQREKEARERAEASETHYRFLADLVPQMIWVSDPAGSVTFLNSRLLEFVGLQPAAEAPIDWPTRLHPDDRQAFMEAWRQALATAEPLEIECRGLSAPAGGYRWLLVRALPMRGAGGEVVRWFGTATDIEAQKQVLAEREQLLAEARKLAAERERLVDELREEAERRNEFLAMLSHELRNPLTPIRNSVYVLNRAVPGGQQARRAREIIERQAHHLTRLVDDLLDTTRIARGKLRLRREVLELNGLLRRSVEDHREQFRGAGLELRLQICEAPLMVHGDPTRLAQVIGNLLQNAAKFTPSGGRVSLSLEAEADTSAVIRIQDTGAGITQEMLAHLFHPFVQADKTLDRSRGGLGLGLALARGIIQSHGGNIEAASPGPGRGAEFTIRLPLETELVSAAGEPVEQRPRSTRRVLIIEDNADAAQSLREALELSQHTVEVARDGAEGIAKAHAFHPEVVLCDIGLPRLDGYGVAQQMRGDPHLSSTFLVALSGYSLSEDVEKSKEAGFDRHLAKPPRMEELERILAQAPARAAAH